MILSLLTVFLFLLHLQSNSVELVFPKNNPKSYNSYLWPGQEKLLIIPKLEAKTSINSATQKICGFKIISSDYEQFFKIAVTDSSKGFGEIYVLNHSELLKKNMERIFFQVEAYDCDPNPHVSDRANMVVNILQKSGSIFSEKEYEFAISEYAPKYSIIGQITILNEPKPNSAYRSNSCGFQLTPFQGQQVLPLNIDYYGVLRTTSSVVGESLIRAIVEKTPCNEENEKKVSTIVNIKVVPQNCQPGWTDLPSYIQYNRPVNSPGFLFWPGNPILSTCWKTCLDHQIKMSVELTDGTGKTYTIEYAEPKNCQHDPKAIEIQRIICGINKQTNTYLLPDPEKDLASQVSSLTIGSLPELEGQVSSWKFESVLSQIWPVAVNSLVGYDKKFAFKTFLNDFTISFWIKRSMVTSEKETILAFTDITNNQIDFVVGFIGREFVISQQRQNSLHSWTCEINEAVDFSDWHHISLQYVGHRNANLLILLDGEPVNVEYDSQTNDLYVDEFSDYILTIGGEVKNNKVLNGFNGELTGFSLLLEEAESMARLSCLAKCGESILLPNADRLVETGTVVDLKSNRISFASRNMTHMSRLLTNIVYTRADPLHRSKSFENMISKSRKLFIRTDFECTDKEVIEIPTLEVDLVIQPLEPIQNSEESVWLKKTEEFNEINPISKDIQIKFNDSEIMLIYQPINTAGYQPFKDSNFITSDYDIVLINECIVTPSHQDGLETDFNEKIIFTSDVQTQLVFNIDKFGVTFKNLGSISEYLTLIRSLRYFVPDNLSLRPDQGQGIVFSRSLNIVCSLDSGRSLTPLFVKKIIVLNTSENNILDKSLETDDQLQQDQIDDVKDFLQDEPILQSESLLGEKRIQQEKVVFEKVSNNTSSIGLIISLSMASGLVLLLAGTAIMYRKKNVSIDIEKPISFSEVKTESMINFRKFGDFLRRYPSTKLTENPTFPPTQVNRSGLSPINIVPQTQMYELLSRKDATFNDMDKSSFNGIYDEEIDVDDDDDFNEGASHFTMPRTIPDISKIPNVQMTASLGESRKNSFGNNRNI